MRLWIAEKPNLGRAIAATLPGPHRDRGKWIECAGDEVVGWCVGHLFEPGPPEVYNESYKTWQLQHLPIIPDEWRLLPRASTRDLIETLRALAARATSIVHCGDPGREGQLLVDQCIGQIGFRGPVERVRVHDMNAIAEAISAIEPNKKFFHLSQSALARQRADWLYGMNLTRLYTLRGKQGGHDSLLSVGRVQTPLLALVVRRDLEIENFSPKPYYVLRAQMVCSSGTFSATWKPGSSVENFIDPEGYFVNRAKALELSSQLTGAAGLCTVASTKRETAGPPLAYSLVDLQIEADRLLGLTAQQTVDVCQSLYEVHRLTTYPRSDCSFLPEGQLSQSPLVLQAIAATAANLGGLVAAADPARRSRAFDDKKVGEHHAIIPTTLAAPNATLSAAERSVYELVARRYIAQFFGPHIFNTAAIEVLVKDEVFTASGRQTLDEGWRVTRPPSAARAASSAEDGREVVQLPAITKGDAVTAAEVAALEKKTKPPKRFTDGTLVEAMKGIAKYVDDPKIKAVLKEQGLGTSATRAGILETLFKREFLERRDKHVISTELGRMLIAAMPPLATKPDLTAVWELAMERISQGQMSLDQFLQAMLRQLRQLIDAGIQGGPIKAPGAKPCPSCGTGVLRERKSKTGGFVGCSRWPDCAHIEGPRARPHARGATVPAG
jgi:DNA topoisomerase-3